MTLRTADCTTLNNGVKMPWLGLGVWKVEDGKIVQETIEQAIQAGYRSIDTAAAYKNETGVGEAVRNSGVARDELFITTKIWNGDQGFEETLNAFEESRQKLGLEYLDLLLIHWPVKGKYKDTWRALEKIYNNGLVRAIGVSNFKAHHLIDLMGEAEIKPMVNQVEYHPLLTQRETHDFCIENHIQLEAWSPLMQGNLDLDILKSIGVKYGKSPAQVVLRWNLQKHVVTIPKSTTPSRIKENSEIFDFNLTKEEVAQIDALNQDKRFGPDPDNFDF
ncbi:aldo/keto reductase [Paenibacillus abyssi]|uniref:Glyoxal reductase n=1 Tax=Paenibacillus abyssi TaxID=1340531 RepID=A0A917G120_9BACL|nr:aldo/keto reductase [Paenibacillus abyssi]GGG17462.1 glyoxal reductase [Paenibacillus abyssi]